MVSDMTLCRCCVSMFARIHAANPRSDWAQRVKEVEAAASRSDERARLAEELGMGEKMQMFKLLGETKEDEITWCQLYCQLCHG